MNRLLILAVVVSGLLLTAHAQSPFAYRVLTLLPGGTNNVAATATNTPAAVGVTCAEQDQVALFIEHRGTGAGSGNVIYAFAKGLDADTVETMPSVTLTVPLNGTNTVRLLSEPTVNGSGYLQLVSIQNTNAVALTNLTVKVSRKNPRRTVNLR
jgi:hypothetical protein